jgi:hypothetical protein
MTTINATNSALDLRRLRSRIIPMQAGIESAILRRPSRSVPPLQGGCFVGNRSVGKTDAWVIFGKCLERENDRLAIPDRAIPSIF